MGSYTIYQAKNVKASFDGNADTVTMTWDYQDKAWEGHTNTSVTTKITKVCAEMEALVYAINEGNQTRPKYEVKNSIYSAKTSSTILDSNTKTLTLRINRSRFYPREKGIAGGSDCVVTHVKCKLTVYGDTYDVVQKKYFNRWAKGAWSRETNKTVAILFPRKPTISRSFNASNGELTFRIKTNEGADTRERYDTYYRITRQDNFSAAYKKETNLVNWTSNTSTDFTRAVDIADHASIAQSQWIRVKCYAYARGLRGDSLGDDETKLKPVESTYYIAHPAAATIGKITCTSASNGTVTIPIKTNSTSTRPVTRVQLQRLANTEIGVAATAAQAQPTSWVNVSGAVDDAQCSGFTDQKSAAMPEVRKHTWYRVVSTYGANTVEGWPVEAKCLYRAKDEASAQAITFGEIKTGVGYVDIASITNTTDNYTHTQVAWADSDDAWESNKLPEMQVMEVNTTRFVIKEQEGREDVYIRARRVTVDDGKVTAHGEWCYPPSKWYPAHPLADPEDEDAANVPVVTLFAPDHIVRDGGITLEWEVSDPDVEQTAWAVYKVVDGMATVVQGGTGPTMRTTIPAFKLAEFDEITLRVGLTIGSGVIYADDATVGIFDVPEVSITADQLTAQPMSVDLSTTTDQAQVRLYVTAKGNVTTSYPDDRDPQLDGDVVWSDVVAPAWSESEGGTLDYDATYTLPGGLDFQDGGEYTVTAVAVDASTGLASEESSAEFGVTWAHQASAPDANDSTIEVDSDELTAAITPAAPEASYALTEDAALDDGKVYYARSVSYTYALTSDTEIDETKTYYTYDDSTDTYTAVADPDASEIATYYERSTVVSFAAVESPDVSDMATYYELAYGDVCDVYRSTPDGAVLIAEGVEFGTTVVDPFAPFSTMAGAVLAYRLCTRTADGDIEWADFGYELAYDAVVVDWDGNRLELPHGKSRTDRGAKSYEAEQRWDGSRPIRWDSGAQREATVTAAVLRHESQNDIALLADLRDHAGACFVRCPDGVAFECNVDVDVSETSFESPVVPVRLSCLETSLTAEFMADAPTEGGE